MATVCPVAEPVEQRSITNERSSVRTPNERGSEAFVYERLDSTSSLGGD